jgi:hypothetical protein
MTKIHTMGRLYELDGSSFLAKVGRIQTMKFHKVTKLFYALGFILAALMFSSIAMVNSILTLDSKGMFIWGIIVIVEGVLFGTAIKGI